MNANSKPTRGRKGRRIKRITNPYRKCTKQRTLKPPPAVRRFLEAFIAPGSPHAKL